MRVVLTTYVPVQVRLRIEDICKETGQSTSAVTLDLIERGLAALDAEEQEAGQHDGDTAAE